MLRARTRKLSDGRRQLLWARRKNKVTESLGLKAIDGQDNRRLINQSNTSQDREVASGGIADERRDITGQATSWLAR